MARAVGLVDDGGLTLDSVDRRRGQLVGIAVVTVMGVAAILALGRTAPSRWTADLRLRALLVGLAAGVVAYVVDRHRRLRSLTCALVDERARTTMLTDRLAEVRTLLSVAQAMNSALAVEVVLDHITTATVEMLGASGASISVIDNSGLRVVATAGPAGAVVGQTVQLADLPAGHPALSHAVWADLTGPEATVTAPILHSGQLFGVLTVVRPGRRNLTDFHGQAARLFAEQAAIAIAHAAARRLSDRSGPARDGAGGPASAHAAITELRDPVSALLAMAKILERPRLTDAERVQLAAVVARQVERLNRIVEHALIPG